jgi:hypothetical protein
MNSDSSLIRALLSDDRNARQFPWFPRLVGTLRVLASICLWQLTVLDATIIEMRSKQMDKKMPCCSVQQGLFEFQCAPGISGIVAET